MHDFLTVDGGNLALHHIREPQFHGVPRLCKVFLQAPYDGNFMRIPKQQPGFRVTVCR